LAIASLPKTAVIKLLTRLGLLGWIAPFHETVIAALQFLFGCTLSINSTLNKEKDCLTPGPVFFVGDELSFIPQGDQ